MGTILRDIQNNPNIRVGVYQRAKQYTDLPELVYFQGKDNNFSCPYQALLECQSIDNKKTLAEFERRYKIILKQMDKRRARTRSI